MNTVLLATDSNDLFSLIDSVLTNKDTKVIRVKNGADVVPAVESQDPQAVILDLQIGNMGGIASCIALRQEEGYDRLSKRPIALLLDREADVFLAEEAKADAWITKPLDSLSVKKLYKQLMSKDESVKG